MLFTNHYTFNIAVYAIYAYFSFETQNYSITIQINKSKVSKHVAYCLQKCMKYLPLLEHQARTKSMLQFIIVFTFTSYLKIKNISIRTINLYVLLCTDYFFREIVEKLRCK